MNEEELIMCLLFGVGTFIIGVAVGLDNNPKLFIAAVRSIPEV
jgi:hypothetical protein